MSNRVFPIGKYRGQPLEVVAQDKKYLEWICAQDWFRMQHSETYQVIINNFCEPSETPEHNALQAKLLDDAWCMKLANIACPGACNALPWTGKDFIEGFRLGDSGRRIDVELTGDALHVLESVRSSAWDKEALRYNDVWSEFKIIQSIRPSAGCVQISHREFEHRSGADVVFTIDHISEWDWRFCPHLTVVVEAKPSIGDDYPAVIRQVKRYAAERYNVGVKQRICLLIGRFSSSAVSVSQFKEICKSSHINVVFEGDVDASDFRPGLFDAHGVFKWAKDLIRGKQP